MNRQKIAFIICTNNPLYFEECQYYIRKLTLPQDMELDIIGVQEAPSMCAGYNAGMHSSDAKYKIYLHQDVFIREPDFILYLLERFRQNEDVGMIGMVGGSGMPKTGVAYLAWNAGTVDCREPDMAYQLICAPGQKEDYFVDAVDGLLMATQYDVEWREDIFGDFDFYDISQAFEMQRYGYKIMVPYQEKPWVIHDSSFAKLNNYDKNRRICLKEYPEFFTEEDGFPFTYHEEWEKLSDALATEVRRRMDEGDWETAADMVASYRKNHMKNSALEMYGIMCDIYLREHECNVDQYFFDPASGFQMAYEKYLTVKFLLGRMECGMPKEEYRQLREAVESGAISCEALLILIIHSVLDKDKVLPELLDWYDKAGKKKEAEQMRNLYRQVKGKPRAVAYSRRIAANQ